MSIDAIRVITLSSMVTGSHACNKAERIKLAFLETVVVSMATLRFIWTRTTEVEDVAQLHLLDAVDLFLVVLLWRRVNSLARVHSQYALVISHGWRYVLFGAWRRGW